MKYKIGDLVSIKVREDFFEVRYPLDPELQGVIGVITEFIDVQQMLGEDTTTQSTPP